MAWTTITSGSRLTRAAAPTKPHHSLSSNPKELHDALNKRDGPVSGKRVIMFTPTDTIASGTTGTTGTTIYVSHTRSIATTTILENAPGQLTPSSNSQATGTSTLSTTGLPRSTNPLPSPTPTSNKIPIPIILGVLVPVVLIGAAIAYVLFCRSKYKKPRIVHPTDLHRTGYGEYAIPSSTEALPPKTGLETYPASPPMHPHGTMSPPPSCGAESPYLCISPPPPRTHSPPHRPPRPETLDLNAIRFAPLPSPMHNANRISDDHVDRNSESSDRSRERDREIYYRYAKQRGFNPELLTRASMRDDPVLRENARKKLSPEPLRIVKQSTAMSEPERRMNPEYSLQGSPLSDGHYPEAQRGRIESEEGVLESIWEREASDPVPEQPSESSSGQRHYGYKRQSQLLGELMATDASLTEEEALQILANRNAVYEAGNMVDPEREHEPEQEFEFQQSARRSKWTSRVLSNHFDDVDDPPPEILQAPPNPRADGGGL